MRSNQLAVLTIPALCLSFCLIQLVSALLPDRKAVRFRDSGLSPSNSYIGHHVRRKRYVLRTKRWRKKDFTWKLLPNNLKEGDDYIVRQENTLHRAFHLWSAASSVTFTETLSPTDQTDFVIAFERGRHDDEFPFDGRDGVVAHAFYPLDGRLHFDADEFWTLNSRQGVNLFQTSIHEIGHLLGLEHSTDPRAAMYGARRPYDPEFALGDDDVRAIRALFPMPEEKNKVEEDFTREPKNEEPKIVENLQVNRRKAVLIDSDTSA
ncbi:hypothetical protein WR25_11868 [Diploscapter pachys]|uniref:Peptidase metallopeptidase domain-containing protein n=1 Tax=Diploscapter pachys TaxID=2018661 RepID=A0A2A2LNJ2_9BILA|nr:hypothetical protein WR25_11868 [Diploscapter pachys]